MKSLNIVLSGVGGQGIISLANVIANAVLESGGKVIVAETHGLSQRGGSVIVHVRIGDVEAPLIPPGNGDLMLSLDPIEAARYSVYLKKGSMIFVDNNITPPPLPGIKIPSLDEIVESLEKEGFDIIVVPAVDEAKKAGNPLGANIFLLGASYQTGILKEYINEEAIIDAIRKNLKKPEKNIEVFKRGKKWAEERLTS